MTSEESMVCFREAKLSQTSNFLDERIRNDKEWHVISISRRIPISESFPYNVWALNHNYAIISWEGTDRSHDASDKLRDRRGRMVLSVLALCCMDTKVSDDSIRIRSLESVRLQTRLRDLHSHRALQGEQISWKKCYFPHSVRVLDTSDLLDITLMKFQRRNIER